MVPIPTPAFNIPRAMSSLCHPNRLHPRQTRHGSPACVRSPARHPPLTPRCRVYSPDVSHKRHHPNPYLSYRCGRSWQLPLTHAPWCATFGRWTRACRTGRTVSPFNTCVLAMPTPLCYGMPGRAFVRHATPCGKCSFLPCCPRCPIWPTSRNCTPPVHNYRSHASAQTSTL